MNFKDPFGNQFSEFKDPFASLLVYKPNLMNEKSDSSVSVDVYRVGSIRDLQ